MPPISRGLLRVLQVLGVVWALPYTLAGLAVGAAGIVAGAHWHFSARDFAVVFHKLPWGPGGAMTLGNVILDTGDGLDRTCLTYEHRAGRCVHPPVRLGDHERAHVYQYMLLGPLFVPLYFLCGGISVRNRFERAADHYAMHGHGWWPWTRNRNAS